MNSVQGMVSVVSLLQKDALIGAPLMALTAFPLTASIVLYYHGIRKRSRGQEKEILSV